MTKKTSQNAKNQDDILQAFEETKGEQLNLLDIVENNNQGLTEIKNTVEQIRQELTSEPEQQEEPEEETKWFTGFDGVRYTEDEWESPCVRNGPTRKEVEGWKKRHDGFVYFTPFDQEVFVWRTLQRPEYREIIRDQTLTALDREEFFTEKCVLFPYDFSLEKIKKSRAGIASLLSEMIMDKSGFVAQSAPIKL